MKNNVLFYTFNKPQLNCFKVCKAFEQKGLQAYYLGLLSELKDVLVGSNFSLVIGLGDSREATEATIETLFQNNYGPRPVVVGGKNIYRIKLPATVSKKMVKTRRFGGPCNRSAYYVANVIESNHLKTSVIFIHIPKQVAISTIVKEVCGMLTGF